MIKITVNLLKEKGGCASGIKWFEEHFPDGVEINEECHFGYFDKALLEKAHRILYRLKDKELEYDSDGTIFLEKRDKIE